MPTVSVLIPAFRPQYLDLAICSALAQTYTDFELLISDDSSDGAVESVVSKWTDSRIRYFRNPHRQLPGANRDHLLRQAQGKYIKFLFDDDFLFPQSIALLIHVAEQSGSQMVFHARHLVDERGVVLSSPSNIAADQWAVLDRRAIFESAIGYTHNFIGEPSNVLFGAEAFQKLDRPFVVAGLPMRFLTDMALYINFVVHGHSISGAGVRASAFRRHGEQASSKNFPAFSAGLFEWELLLRWAMDLKELEISRYLPAMALMHATYREHLPQFPELAAFLEVDIEPGPSGYLNDKFRHAVSLAHVAIELRRLALAGTSGNHLTSEG